MTTCNTLHKHMGVRINARLFPDVKLCEAFIEQMRTERYARYEIMIDTWPHNGHVIFTTCLAENEGLFFNSLTTSIHKSVEDARTAIDTYTNRTQLHSFIEFLNEGFSPMGSGYWLGNHSADTEFSHSQIVDLYLTKEAKEGTYVAGGQCIYNIQQS